MILKNLVTGKTEVSCNACFKVFDMPLSIAKKTRYHLCSSECCRVFKERGERSHPYIVKCSQCGMTFRSQDLSISGLYFCNEDCKDIYWADHKALQTCEKHYCNNPACGAEIEPGFRRKKFCSDFCRQSTIEYNKITHTYQHVTTNR